MGEAPRSTGPERSVVPRTRASTATALAALVFAGAIALLSWRTATKLNVPGAPDPLQFGLADFRDAIYYPVVAFLEGRNPYDTASYMAAYPVGNRFPVYLPATLLVHLPFGLLPFEAAELAYYVLTIGLALVIAAQALRGSAVPLTGAAVLVTAALLLLSRAGHWNLILGQYAATLAVGSYLALADGRRPWRAGVGLALVAIKPTYGVPLALLMLVRGDWAAVAIGAALSGAASAIALLRLAAAAGGWQPLMAAVQGNLATFNTSGSGHAVESLFRLDAVSVLARALGRPPDAVEGTAVTVAVLGLGMLAVRACARRPGDADAARLSMAVICVTTLLAVYHMGYDLVLLTWPIVALLVGNWAPPGAAPPALRWLLALLLLGPAFNYLASGTAMHALAPLRRLELAVAGLNGAALVATLLLYTAVALRAARLAGRRA